MTDFEREAELAYQDAVMEGADEAHALAYPDGCGCRVCNDRLSARCDDGHEWPADHTSGDTCWCGELYLTQLPDGRMKVTTRDRLQGAPLMAASTPHDRAAEIRERFAREGGCYSHDALQRDLPWLLNALATERRLRAQAEKERWQPIETAPKDGTRVVVTDDKNIWISQWCEREADHLFPNGIHQWSTWWNEDQPTLWMPLPAAPSVATP